MNFFDAFNLIDVSRIIKLLETPITIQKLHLKSCPIEHPDDTGTSLFEVIKGHLEFSLCYDDAMHLGFSIFKDDQQIWENNHLIVKRGPVAKAFIEKEIRKISVENINFLEESFKISFTHKMGLVKLQEKYKGKQYKIEKGRVIGLLEKQADNYYAKDFSTIIPPTAGDLDYLRKIYGERLIEFLVVFAGDEELKKISNQICYHQENDMFSSFLYRPYFKHDPLRKKTQFEKTVNLAPVIATITNPLLKEFTVRRDKVLIDSIDFVKFENLYNSRLRSYNLYSAKELIPINQLDHILSQDTLFDLVQAYRALSSNQ